MHIFNKMDKEQEVKIIFRGHEFSMALKDLLDRVDANGVGNILGTNALYFIDNIKSMNPLTIEIVSAETEMNTITSASIADRIMPIVQKRGRGLSHIHIELGIVQVDDKTYLNNRVGFMKVPENLASRLGVFDIEDSVVFRHGKDFVRINSTDKYPATLQIISVHYAGDEEQGKYAIENGIFMKPDKNGNYKFYIKQGDKLYDLESGEVVFEGNGLIKYVPFPSSASSERRKSLYFIDASTEERKRRADEILDLVTSGAYSIDYGKEMQYAKFAKLAGRWTQFQAPSVSLGSVGRYALFDGVINENRLDGMMYGSATFVADAILKMKGYRIHPDALNGIFMQIRPTLIKAGMIITKDEYIENLIYTLDPNPIVFRYEDVTEEIINNIRNGQYRNRIIIIGDPEEPIAYVADRNALKSDYDFRIVPEFTVLRFLKSTDSNFSSTIFQKCVAKDANKAINLAKRLFVEFSAERLNSMLEPKARVLSPDKFEGAFYMDEILENVFPKYVMMDSNFAINKLDNVTKSINKALDRFKVPMNGKNAGLTVGLEVAFGLKSFLGDHEVYCHSLERMLKKEERPEEKWKVFMIKYPSMDIDEYQVARLVSTSELKKRIKASGLSKDMQNMFIDYYCSLHDSVIVVPACEVFKNMLAGSDFDTDQVCCSIDEELVELLENEPVAIVCREE